MALWWYRDKLMFRGVMQTDHSGHLELPRFMGLPYIPRKPWWHGRKVLYVYCTIIWYEIIPKFISLVCKFYFLYILCFLYILFLSFQNYVSGRTRTPCFLPSCFITNQPSHHRFKFRYGDKSACQAEAIISEASSFTVLCWAHQSTQKTSSECTTVCKLCILELCML